MEWKKIESYLSFFGVDTSVRKWENPKAFMERYGEPPRGIYVFCKTYQGTPLVNGKYRTRTVNAGILDQFNLVKRRYNKDSIDLMYKIDSMERGTKAKVVSYLADKTEYTKISWSIFIHDDVYTIPLNQAPYNLIYSKKRKIFVDLISPYFDSNGFLNLP